MRTKKLLPILLVLIALPAISFAQELLVPLHDDYQTDIQQVVYSSKYRFHTSMRPWIESDIAKIINLDSLKNTRWIEKRFNKRWKQEAWDMVFNKNFLSVHGDDFFIAVNPNIDFQVGYDKRSKETIWVNTRGVEIKGTIGKNFAFYTNVKENQAVFPQYLTDYNNENRIIPGQGKYKRFKDKGFDFSNTTAYISYAPSHWLNLQLGQGKNFIGDGYRSLILSDNAFPYPFLKLTAKIWNIQYTVLYNQMMDLRSKFEENIGYERKYTTMHHLSWAITKRLNVGFFDAVVWQAKDSTGQRDFDWQYLNPIIFLRPVEFSVGSPDNALMGLSASYIFGQHTVAYGQVILDEFKWKEIKSRKGWCGNKQAFQLGVKAYNSFGVKNLFLQTEYNYVRPYMYTHYSRQQNYAHYNAALAHPWGANFWESVSRANYHYNRWYIQYQLNFGVYGGDIVTEDGTVLNYGGDIFKNYRTRVQEYDNKVGQGLKTNILINDLMLSWLVNPIYNLNIFANLTIRNVENDLIKENDVIFRFGIRTSLERYYYDF